MKPKLLSKRRAVSPVIATVLLIALVTAAAAIVFFVVLPMVQGTPELVSLGASVLDDDGNDYADGLIINYQNIGSGDTSITSIEVYRYNESVSWTSADTLPLSIKSNGKKALRINADAFEDEVKYPEKVYIRAYYEEGDLFLTTMVEITSTYSPYALIYSEDFNSYADGYVPIEFSYYLVATHSGGTGVTHTINDWQVQSGELRMIANDCSYLILSGSEYLYSDVNMSFVLTANDDDELGIIFRWNDDGGVQSYYYVSYTNNHGMSNHFAGDNIPTGQLTLSYVEDDTISVIDSAAWNRNDNAEYSYRVEASGSSIKVYIGSQLYIDTTDTTLSIGNIGIASAAMLNSRFDNILVWTGGV